MKKSAFFLALLVFIRLGFSFSTASGTSNIANFFLGPPSLSQSSLNQVLQLLIGPTGSVGPAGPAGANGLNGINGTNGVNGAVGPAGPAGPAGANGAQGLQGPAGANGVAGPAGPAGAQGPAGPAGPASTVSSIQLGSGSAGVNSCASQVQVAIHQHFSGGIFLLSSVNVSGISSDCSGKNLTIYLSLSSSRTVTCTQTLPAWATPNPAVLNHSAIFDESSPCTPISLGTIQTSELQDPKPVGISLD